MGRFATPRFDAAATFVVAKPRFKVNGQLLPLGSVFDKSSVPRQKLKAFYEARKIAMRDALSPVPQAEHAERLHDPWDDGAKLWRDAGLQIEGGELPAGELAKRMEEADAAAERELQGAQQVPESTHDAPIGTQATADELTQRALVTQDYEIKKGPKGLFYQYRGTKRVSKGFASEAEAQLAPPPANDAAEQSE